MVALSHDLIPHHHHDMPVYVVSFQLDQTKEHGHLHDTDHFHHGESENHHVEITRNSESHHHNFPLHHHNLAGKEQDYLRAEFKRVCNPNLRFIAVLFTLNNLNLPPTPELDFVRFTEIPFFIKSSHEPGATGLRAPPAIA